MDYLPFFSVETWILLITFICLFVIYGNWTHGIFEKLGIPGPKPYIYWGTIGRNHPVYYEDDNLSAKKYGRVWGLYEFRRPMLVVMEPDMLKTILVKECFTYFTNRRNLRLNGELYDSVSTAEDDQWRRIRNILTSFFTSRRIKEMFSIMKHHSSKLTASLQSKAHNNEVITVKDFFGAYSMDVMTSCAFSVDVDSINNPSSPLIIHASKLFRLPISVILLQGFFPVLLPLLDLLGVSLFSKTSTAFFKTLLEKIRAERNGSSDKNLGDILQHMINSQTANAPSKEKQNKGLTDHEILSQATMFVFTGYETSATTLVFLAYNLARNPEVMKRLQEEIDSTFPNKGAVQYEDLMQMEYLDSVVNESLRLYPPAGRIDRVAKETVKISGITIPKDMMVMIPVYALHRDPELWPEPEEFKPDRFSTQNKQSINPYTYLPFGYGPRNCLGMRFALVLVKLALVEVLQNYSFSVCGETEIPLTMDPKSLVGPLNPIKLKVGTRSITSGNEDKSN
ncbi:cytochrome P450 3A30 isoform X1 [Anarrhichthys ocellatus]|uniref:cytochrome P450 3A30 isoform X1 n=1 Tax=Anarrhichthys ocellatus TaxID=433405 RepID=UPI0012ED57DE|nr:cytochrome P450 3A30-like isoform X1 [Anarrhichthys ocellatus]